MSTAVVHKTSTIYAADAGADSFARFLSWTDEKDVIARAIRREIGDEPGQRLLDVGAGDGAILRRLGVSRLSSVTAVEPGAPSMIQRLLASMAAVPSVEHRVLNCRLEDARARLGTYDVIIAAHSLRYVAGVAAQLQRLRDCNLCPGGRLLVVDLAPTSSYWDFYLRYERQLATTHHTDPALYDYTALLQTLFARVRCVPIRSTMVAPSAADFLGILDFIFDTPSVPAAVAAQIRLEMEARKSTLVFDHILYVCDP